MNSYISIFILLQIANVLADFDPFFDVPPKCQMSPPEMRYLIPSKCCSTVKPAFKKEDYQACSDHVVSNGTFGNNPKCSQIVCLMRRNNLLNADDSYDFAALDKYFMLNILEQSSNWSLYQLVKKRCFKTPTPGPKATCDHGRMLLCIGSTLFMECGVWNSQDKNCNSIKQFYNECKDYFFK